MHNKFGKASVSPSNRRTAHGDERKTTEQVWEGCLESCFERFPGESLMSQIENMENMELQNVFWRSFAVF